MIGRTHGIHAEPITFGSSWPTGFLNAAHIERFRQTAEICA